MEDKYTQEPIAIIGSGCRFPGESTSPSKLWTLLHQSRDVLRDIDPEHLNLKRFYNPNGDIHGATNVDNKTYLFSEDSRMFDPGFFGISPLEAEGMDPQQRVLLETVFEAIEAAGYTLDQLGGSQTSVHVGVMTGDYADIQLRDIETVPRTSRSILSNRVSYVFDLHGPSVTIDCACSSSLVAMHQAIQSMLAGDSTCAIAGGVNLIFDPSLYIMESKLHMLSPDSRSRMWDKSANGYARGEGAAALFLKPRKTTSFDFKSHLLVNSFPDGVSHAIRDNDHIEAVIRSTGVNSDGHSQGITMPRASAQSALIQQTYRRAGLDPIKDRCQYFECHGTGTTAGDPVEARAISDALLGDPNVVAETASGEIEPLYVGSIKTVVGHLEGCAGLAGVMKVILALQNRTIPPNMLFQELNPEIEQYYGRMLIPTSPLPWPQVQPGAPLRASVNSFGFGGTNCHAIIESYDNAEPCKHIDPECSRGVDGPFLFSANSEVSLLGNIKAVLQHLIDKPDISLYDLAWVLQTRRTAHRVKTSFAAESRQQLVDDMKDFVAAYSGKASPKTGDIGTRSQLIDANEESGILGVFTGQGAQWPAMGQQLVEKSALFRKSIEECDAVLRGLSDGPEWSLVEELCAPASVSRMSEAEISQPLCTALQIALVDLLDASKVRFAAVVGHSSGEIAAVYACGIIDLPSAIKIAYYRGKYAHLAHGHHGEAGAMLALGLGLDEAVLFCNQPQYRGRISVAASNAPQTVTLSGDIQIIQQAKEHFESTGIFVRILRVDTAYHSHHMDRCADDYLRSLKACNIEVRRPKDGCIWNSSVRGDTELLNGDLESLKGPYWVKNMTDPVFFSHALKSALWHGGPFDMAIEVGPAPALKGPTQQTLKSAFGTAPPYTGLLVRGGSDSQAFSSALGFIWQHLGASFVDFDGYRRASYSSAPKPKVLKGLPPYAWEHDRVYWRESRISSRFRKGLNSSHELLGRRAADDTERDMRWRNVLKLSEIPWVRGHEILGEALLPGASYISLAFEAGRRLAGERQIRLLEVRDVDIRRPVVVPNNREGSETIFTLHVADCKDSQVLETEFAYYYCPDERVGAMIHTCSGRLLVHFGPTSTDELPPRTKTPFDLLPIDVDETYSVLNAAGMQYTGIFRRLQNIQRTLGYASATASWTADELRDNYVAHPALVDVCFQSLIVARSDPSAGLLSSTLLPVHIKKMTLNPSIRWANDKGDINLSFESFVTQRDGAAISGDLHIYDASSGKAILQVEALSVKPISELTESEDRKVFSEIIYKPDVSLAIVEQERDPKHDRMDEKTVEDIERFTLYYMQRALKSVSAEERSGLLWYFQRMLESFEALVHVVQSGFHPLARKEWLTDGPEVADALFQKYPDQIDMIGIRIVGENIASVVRGEAKLLELLLKDNVLGRIYMHGCGYSVLKPAIISVLEQIAHKFPRADILEIGAGTGATTGTLFETMGDAFGTFTFTDISTGFFETAAHRFAAYSDRMIFKALDVEMDVVSQGFQKHAYDVVIAANVLHATSSITSSLQNARSLLKPGGFLLLVEITGLQILRAPFSVGGFEGWYLGAPDNRPLHPGITTEEWDSRLQDSGFSGVDMAFHDTADYSKHCFSVLVSQALDDTLLQVRDPLAVATTLPPESSVTIIGGKTLAVSKIASTMKRLIPQAWNSHVTSWSDIQSIDFSQFQVGSDIVCMQELDNPLFLGHMTDDRLVALQKVFLRARSVLWVTRNRRISSAHSNMLLGITRALSQELPQVKIQMLDLESNDNSPASARIILEVFGRLRIHSLHPGSAVNTLWSHESEVVFANGRILIPRVIPNPAMNNRYNSISRTIIKNLSSTNAAIGVATQGNRLVLVEGKLMKDSKKVSVVVKYALHIPSGPGQSASVESTPVVVLSQLNSSIIEVSQEDIAPIDQSDCTPNVLQAIATYLLAQAACRSVTQEHSVVFYGATESMATIITDECCRQGKHALYATSSTSVPSGWIHLHPQSSVRALQSVLPLSLEIYVDCSSSSTLYAIIPMAALPPTCKTRIFDASIVHENVSTPAEWLARSYATVRNRFSSAGDDATDYCLSSGVVETQNLQDADSSILERCHITSWQSSVPLNVNIQPIDQEHLFNPNKSYLMVGMAGGLGLSICAWALRQGAKHLIITSRNPVIDPEWLEHARLQGAKVYIHAMDVSNRSSVESVIGLIQTTLPPIGGVCNAAMVLNDKLFHDMNADDINVVLGPKVIGSQYLHEILAETPMEFFVLLSSLGTVIGNPGQSNYHAANEFMVGLANQRRRSGLPASVIHIGAVTDVGYVARQESNVKTFFRSLHVSLISESDVHYAFAEAIFAGQPDSGRNYEILLGLAPINKQLSLEERPAWVREPRCSFLLPPSIVQKDQRLARLDQENIKQLIEEVSTEEEAILIVTNKFCVKLESTMQLPPGSVETELSLISLGIDSLVAVEIRIWFLKELGTDIPVLKILGGDSVAQICTAAAKQVLAKNLGKMQVKVEPVATSDSMLIPPIQEVQDPSDNSSSTGNSSQSALGDDYSSGTSEADLQPSLDEEQVQTSKFLNMSMATLAEPLTRDIIREEKMSGPQARIWIASKYLKNLSAYNMMFAFDTESLLDIWALKDALMVVMQHHESLRTCFYARPEDKEPMQGILSHPILRFKHVQNANSDDLTAATTSARTKQWDIEHGETLGVTVLSRAPSAHTIVFAYHHIVMDATGWYIFLRDLNQAYQRRPLHGSSRTYIDYTIKQQQAEQSGLFLSQLKYWQREYSSLPQVLPLFPNSRQRSRPNASNLETFWSHREIDSALALEIKTACRLLRITPFHFHLALIQVLFKQCLDIDDLSIGIADANRLDDEYAETIGFFMNLLPVRFQVAKDSKFSQVAQNTARKVLAALANSTVPFDLIIDSLKVHRSTSHTPLFQVAVNYRLGASTNLPLGDSFLSLKDVQDAKNPYDISFGIVERESGALAIEATFQRSLYDFEACQDILDTYIRLLKSLSSDVDLPIQDCQIYEPDMKSSALEIGRGPRVNFDWQPTLSDRVLEICQRQPEKTAIQYGSTILTYAQLHRQINAIAAAILDTGCTTGSCIAVRCEPSCDFIASLLAIFHIGGIYVPLDMSLPPSRHETILETLHADLLLCHSPTKTVSETLATKCKASLLSVDNCGESGHSKTGGALADSPAIVLFTSGSTGVPKGVVLSQANLRNHVALKSQILQLSEGSDSVLQQSSMSFDMSLIQTFCALCNGGTLVIVPKEIRQDPIEITKLVEQHQITLTIATPSEYLTWLRYGAPSLERSSSWRLACIGGEPVSARLKREIQRLGLSRLSLLNCYGPTEITAAATFHQIRLDEVEPEHQSTVGKALPNYSVCILQPNGSQVLPIGSRGEICVGGAGVALGYFASPAETASKFISSIDECGRMYRTGDEGFLRADGTLVFLGRLDGDTQIKLRGIRIELGEVEAAILKVGQEFLSNVAVSCFDGVLVAHAVLTSGADVNVNFDLQQILGQLSLPQYMVPSRIILLDDMPTTTNGKLDRKALREMPFPDASSESTPQAKLTLREGELRLLWEKVLPPRRLVSFKPTSDFFLEGGNSLSLVKLQHDIKESMGVALSIRDLYHDCTLQQMAARVFSAREAQVPDDEEIDWALESAIPASLLAAGISNSQYHSRERGGAGMEVLLTGATSFLGRAILQELIKEPSIGRIHCVAVLPDEYKSFPDSEKVVLYTGSLSSPSLGLSQVELSNMQEFLDVIIHAGASGHCLNNYSSVRAGNVHSTQFLARLALPNTIPLLYISSNRVTLLSGTTAGKPVSVSEFPPPTTGAEGFTASKWASECFLENLAERTNLAIEVHRPCVVVGDSAPGSDALNAILRYSLFIKAVPVYEKMEGYLDLKPVEAVACELVVAAIAMGKTESPQVEMTTNNVSFHHHSSGVKVPVAGAGEYMSQLHGCFFEEVDIRDWMERAIQAGMDPLIATYLESLVEGGQTLRFPYLGGVSS